MMTNPSCYKSIYKQDRDAAVQVRRTAARLFKRHAAKLLVSAATFVLVFTSFMMMGTDASGSNPAAAAQNEQVVTVKAGDTLWNIAKLHSDKSDDVRFIIFMIKERNGLQSADIKPGQKLVIPSF
ncbi:Cell division suppressor protein YneA [compost metagenome]